VFRVGAELYLSVLLEKPIPFPIEIVDRAHEDVPSGAQRGVLGTEDVLTLVFTLPENRILRRNRPAPNDSPNRHWETVGSGLEDDVSHHNMPVEVRR